MVKIVSFILMLFLSGAAMAGSPPAKLKKALEQILPEVSLDGLKPAPIPGLYEVVIGTDVFYATADGKYLITGALVDIKTQENLTEVRRGGLRLGLIDAVGEENMIIYEPAKPKRTITVFTDVDCPYCAKLHSTVPELVKKGLRIRYLLYPRDGLESETYKKSVAVWCAKDRQKALDVAETGGKLDMKTCPNPVADHYRLAEQIRVRGTPTIVFGNGRMMPGYIPPARLLAMVGLGKKVDGKSGKR